MQCILNIFKIFLIKLPFNCHYVKSMNHNIHNLSIWVLCFISCAVLVNRLIGVLFSNYCMSSTVSDAQKKTFCLARKYFTRCNQNFLLGLPALTDWMLLSSAVALINLLKWKSLTILYNSESKYESKQKLVVVTIVHGLDLSRYADRIYF